jgi:hypothetical protein
MKRKLATDFPLIPERTLSRIIEACDLPRKSQGGGDRAIDARRLAMRLRGVQAAPATDPGITPADSPVWRNVMEFLDDTMRRGEFDTLGEFCEGWLGYQAKVIGETPATGKQPAAKLATNANPPGVNRDRAIAVAIQLLQRELARPPFAFEVVDYCTAIARGDAYTEVAASDVSLFIKRWKLAGMLPDAKRNPVL